MNKEEKAREQVKEALYNYFNIKIRGKDVVTKRIRYKEKTAILLQLADSHLMFLRAVLRARARSRTHWQYFYDRIDLSDKLSKERKRMIKERLSYDYPGRDFSHILQDVFGVDNSD